MRCLVAVLLATSAGSSAFGGMSAGRSVNVHNCTVLVSAGLGPHAVKTTQCRGQHRTQGLVNQASRHRGVWRSGVPGGVKGGPVDPAEGWKNGYCEMFARLGQRNKRMSRSGIKRQDHTEMGRIGPEAGWSRAEWCRRRQFGEQAHNHCCMENSGSGSQGIG